MSRIEQINELLRSQLANLINQEVNLENGLITISYVECSPDLHYAKISISVLPENLTGSALKKLRQSSNQFSRDLKKELNLKYIPRFNWVIDNTEKMRLKLKIR